MIEPEQWLEIEPMDVDDDEYETINIRAMDIAKMDPAQKELFEWNAMLDKECRISRM